MGIWHAGGTTSGDLGGESSQSSTDTSTKLTETMRKMASKIRTETKVTVSTEAESTFEVATASEIQNPNEEIAITYVYSKLQHQYEVLTRLAEIQNVVMVAEKLPAPPDINFDWVKRYDWIIAKVLLDDSFRDALSSISQEIASPDNLEKGMVTDLQAARDKTIDHLGSFASSNSTANNIDMVEESQQGYRITIKERIEHAKSNFYLEVKRHRLYGHIRENILHYCRAIWKQEDPQQRVLRYRKLGIKVPLDWRYTSAFLTNVPVNDFLSIFLYIEDPNISGQFFDDPYGREVDLADLINPAGPIGFYGNYAIYYMRPEYGSPDIFNMLHIFKSPYLYYDAKRGEEILMDPLQIEFTENNPLAGISDKDIDEVKVDMISDVPELRLEYAIARRKVDEDTDPQAVNTFLSDYQSFKEHYAEYLFRKEQSRRFLVDANSLVIDIVRGEGSALEQFKLAHRGLDVLKAYEEKEQLRLEKERRGKRLDLDQLRDPDIEKVVIIKNSNDPVSSAVAGAEASDGPSSSTGSPTETEVE